MSVYLVTREGLELGTFKTSKIAKGLKTGFFRDSDLGWRESSGWQGLFDIVSSSKFAAFPSSSSFMNPDNLNPYVGPTTHAQAEISGVVPLRVSKELTGTKPWVRFISIVIWIGCAIFLSFMALGIYSIAATPQTDAKQIELPIRTIAITTGYGLVLILLIYPTLKLNKYASKISRLSESGAFEDLAAALAEQRRFWKFSGILMILYVCLTLLLFIGSFFVTRVH